MSGYQKKSYLIFIFVLCLLSCSYKTTIKQTPAESYALVNPHLRIVSNCSGASMPIAFQNAKQHALHAFSDTLTNIALRVSDKRNIPIMDGFLQTVSITDFEAKHVDF